jgi:hypothetical protein
MIELFLVLAATAALVAWWQLMHGRQKARGAAGHVCQNHGLQLLDDTVSLSSVSWNRGGDTPGLVVSYGFEFATNGAIRRKGVASLSFPSTLTVTLDLEDGRLIEKFTAR